MTFTPDMRNFQSVPLKKIDRDNTLTDFSMGPDPEPLQTSIFEIGISHPVTLIPVGGGYTVVCGHRRVRLAEIAKLETIPACVLSSAPDDETILAANLSENLGHRRYSDIEKGGILIKLRNAGVPEERIIRKYMPIAGLERSKKLFQDFIKTENLGGPLKSLLHEADVPLRNFQILCGWDTDSLSKAEELFAILKPGTNKWRDLLELIDDIGRRDEIPPSQIILRQDLQSVLGGPAKNEKYDGVADILHALRFPVLDDLQRKLARAIDRLALDPRTRVRTPQNFESEEIRIELKFNHEQELIEQVEKLSKASRSEALSELIRLFKDRR